MAVQLAVRLAVLQLVVDILHIVVAVRTVVGIRYHNLWLQVADSLHVGHSMLSLLSDDG